MKSQEINAFRKVTLLEKCPNTELFLVRIFPHLERIRRDCRYGKIRTRNNSVFGHFSRSVFVIISNVGMKINADVNVKVVVIKIYLEYKQL